MRNPRALGTSDAFTKACHDPMFLREHLCASTSVQSVIFVRETSSVGPFVRALVTFAAQIEGSVTKQKREPLEIHRGDRPFECSKKHFFRLAIFPN